MSKNVQEACRIILDGHDELTVEQKSEILKEFFDHFGFSNYGDDRHDASINGLGMQLDDKDLLEHTLSVTALNANGSTKTHSHVSPVVVTVCNSDQAELKEYAVAELFNLIVKNAFDEETQCGIFICDDTEKTSSACADFDQPSKDDLSTRIYVEVMLDDEGCVYGLRKFRLNH